MPLLDLLCPTRCEGCGEPGALICSACRLALAAPPMPHQPSPCPPGLPSLWVVAAYDGRVRELLLGFKERGAVGLVGELAVPLMAAVRAVVASEVAPVLLVPVPSSPTSVRRRGDDVVWMLARRAARRLRAEGVDADAAQLLVHRRAVADSAGLSAVARADNLRGAFGLRPGGITRCRHRAIVVVDDLVTTGATLSEATRALQTGEVVVRGAAAVAATHRHGGGRSGRIGLWPVH